MERERDQATGSITMKRKRHSEEEIAAKLRQAEGMAAQGSSQNEIVRALHISAMTYHRWRKARAGLAASESDIAGAAGRVAAIPVPVGMSRGQTTQAGALELENQRLRRLVTDLLLEKMRLEEALGERQAVLETIRG